MRAYQRRTLGYVIFGLIIGLLISATTVETRIARLNAGGLAASSVAPRH